eukprot:3031530-Rhodomonas_salina.4
MSPIVQPAGAGNVFRQASRADDTSAIECEVDERAGRQPEEQERSRKERRTGQSLAPSSAAVTELTCRPHLPPAVSHFIAAASRGLLPQVDTCWVGATGITYTGFIVTQ